MLLTPEHETLQQAVINAALEWNEWMSNDDPSIPLADAIRNLQQACNALTTFEAQANEQHEQSEEG